jgi:hypothetical protein
LRGLSREVFRHGCHSPLQFDHFVRHQNQTVRVGDVIAAAAAC